LAETEGGKKSLIQIIFMFLIFFCLVGFTVLVLRPLQISIQRNMEALKDAFIGKAEAVIGKKLEYGSLGPSIFGTLDLRDVRVLKEDGSVVLSVSRLRLSYSLLALIQGRFSEAFSSARVDRPALNLDFERDGDLLRLFSASPDKPENLSLQLFLPEDFHISLRNGRCDAAGKSGGFSLQNLGIDASIHRGQISFQGRWNARGSLNPSGKPGLGDMFAGTGTGGSRNVFSASMSGRINGEYSMNTGEGMASAAIPSLWGDSFRLKPLSVNISFRDRKLEIRKTYDRTSADIFFVWDMAEEKLGASFTAENFSPRDWVTLTGPWRNHNPWLSLVISGRASLEKEANQGPDYSIGFSGTMPSGTVLGYASFAVAAQGDEKGVEIQDLFLDSSRGSLSFVGDIGFEPFSPNGFLSVANLGLIGDEAPDERINAELYISTRGREISVFGDNLRAGTVTLSALDASIFQEDQGLTFVFSTLRFRDMEDYGEVRLSSLSLEGSLDYQPRHIQASLRLDSFSVRDMLELARPLGQVQALSGLVLNTTEDLLVTTEVFFTTDYEHILYNAPRFVAAYEGPQDILAIASVSGTDRRFELDEGQVSWSGGAAGITGMVDFSNPDDISFSLGASHKALIYYLEGSVLDRNSLSIRGSYGLQVYLSAAGMGAYSGYAAGDSIPISSGDQYAQLGFMVSFRYDSPGFWSADIDRFELTGIAVPGSSSASLSFSGRADQDGAGIPDILYDDGRGGLWGNMTLGWDPGYRNFRLSLGINDREEKETYRLRASYGESRLDLFLEGEGMLLSRLTQRAGNAVASGDLRLSWKSGESFGAGAELKSLVFRLGNADVRVSAAASINPEEFLLRDLKMDYMGLEAVMPFFRVDRRASLAETRAEIHGALAGRGVDISLRGEAEFKPLRSWLDLEEALDSIEGYLSLDTARYDTLEAGEPFGFNFSYIKNEEGPRIALSGGPGNMIRFRYSPEPEGGGDFYAALSNPSPVRGSFIGYLDSKTIDAQVSDLYVDMGSLWRFLPPQDTVAFPGGIVTASIRVAGPLGDPEFYGAARATSMRIQVPEYLTEDIRPVPVNIYLDGNEMSFGPVDAAVGEGSGVVSAWFRFERWIPNIFNLDVTVLPEDPIPYGFDISGILARGLVSGNLNLAMADMVLSVSGDLSAHNTEISLNTEEIAVQDGSWDSSSVTTVTDITIRSGRRVEFFWPNAEFPMLQAYADMGTGFRITSDSASRRFTLLGDVQLRSGEIFYLERNFYIREGTLFFNENESEFDPRISARAEIRDQSENGTVTISMIIENAPLMSFTPRFESSPPLSQLEIFSMLGQNPQGTLMADAADRRNPMLSFAGDALTQFIVLRRLQKEVRNFLGLDMFSIRTQVLQNMVYQVAGFNDSGSTDADPVEREYRAGNYFDNTTVFFGKYIGSDIFVQSLFSFRYDAARQTWGGLKLEPEIGLEMRNPLFNIRFSMVPLHPENWFIDDISFTLTWKRSF
jgi:hypothetical protein